MNLEYLLGRCLVKLIKWLRPISHRRSSMGTLWVRKSFFTRRWMVALVVISHPSGKGYYLMHYVMQPTRNRVIFPFQATDARRAGAWYVEGEDGKDAMVNKWVYQFTGLAVESITYEAKLEA